MPVRLLAAVLATALPAVVSAAWQTVASEQGKRVEIDRDSIVPGQNGGMTAKGRIVLDKPIIDPKTSVSYRVIEIESRYDCAERTHATLKRTYFKDEGEVLRQEEVRSPFEMPVRSGTPDDRLLREVCRPKGSAPAIQSVNKTLDKVNEASGDLRKANEALVEQAVKKDLQQLSRQAVATLAGKGAASAPVARKRTESAPAALHASPVAAPQAGAPGSWSYEGPGGPAFWSRLRSEYALCASGRRQSPIDLRDGFAVDLEPIQFFYAPASYRVIDSQHRLQLGIHGGGLMLLGKQYRLLRVEFHAPSEHTVDGKTFDMEAQLVHKSDDGKLAIVSAFLEKGAENPVVQAALNNLPLEKGGEVAPPGQVLDVGLLLPSDKNYFTFMGSLTTPPCTEDVLWLVLKQVQHISPEQLSIFKRLYPPNARPVQPSFARIIKESR